MEISDLKVTCANCGKKVVLYNKSMKVGTDGKIYCVMCYREKMAELEKDNTD